MDSRMRTKMKATRAIVIVPTSTRPVTRSSTKRKLETVKEQLIESIIKPKRRRLSKIPTRAATRESNKPKQTLKRQRLSKIPVRTTPWEPSKPCKTPKRRRVSRIPIRATRLESSKLNNAPKRQRLSKIPVKATFSESIKSNNIQKHQLSKIHVKTILRKASSRALRSKFCSHCKMSLSYRRSPTRNFSHRQSNLHTNYRHRVLHSDSTESLNIHSSTDSSITHLKLITNDQTGISERPPFIKQEWKEVSLFDSQVFTPIPDTLSPIPPVKSPYPSIKSSPTSEVPIPGLHGQSPSASETKVSHQIKQTTAKGTTPAYGIKQSTSVNVQCPINRPLTSNAEECCPPLSPLLNLSPIQSLQPVDAPLQNCLMSSPGLPLPIYASSPLKTNFANVAKTSFSSPLDGHRSLYYGSPPIVDPSTPSLLVLESSVSSTEPLAISFGQLSIPNGFNSPMIIDPPTPDYCINSSSSFVDPGPLSLSGCAPLLTPPLKGLPQLENRTHMSDVNIHPSPYPHIKIPMTHNVSSMSGIEPLIESFSEYPTPDQGFVDPEKDPITNHPLISGPMKMQPDRVRCTNISKARRSLQFTSTDPCLAETNVSIDNPKQIPLIPSCPISTNNENDGVYAQDNSILDWLNTASPPMQWMHEELLRSEEQRNDQQEQFSSPRVSTPLSLSRMVANLPNLGWYYSSPNEDEVKHFADEDSDTASISTLSPIVTAASNKMTNRITTLNTRRHSNASFSVPNIIPYQTNHLSSITNSLPTFIGNTIYPGQQVQNDVSPLQAIQQAANYKQFTEASVKLLPIQTPFRATLAPTPIQRQPNNGILQFNTHSTQQTCFYSPTPQFQFPLPVPQVQTFSQQTLMSSTPTYFHPQPLPSFYQPFPSTPIVQTPLPLYDTLPTPEQIYTKTLLHQSTLSTTTPNHQFLPDSKKPIPATETITSNINANRASQSSSHSQGQHKELYHKIGPSTSPFSVTRHKQPSIISRPEPCSTPLPRQDPYINNTVTVVKQSAKDLEILRQLKYFDIDTPKLLRLKAAHMARRYITSQYVQHALDGIPDEVIDEPVPYPFIIDTAILRDALSTSCASPQHFARYLFDQIFTVAEFRDHNIGGVGSRRALNKSKMSSIKVAVSTIFPMENNEWQRCEISINNHIKSLEKKMKRLTWLKFEKYQT